MKPSRARTLPRAALELWPSAPAEPRRRYSRGSAALCRGRHHAGAFGSGGPMVVYVLGRIIGSQKAAFRSTLAVLWLVLNSMLLFSFARDGNIGEASLRLSGAFGLAMLVGLFIGQKIHDRVDAKRFQVTVFGMLGVVGAVLVIKNAI